MVEGYEEEFADHTDESYPMQPATVGKSRADNSLATAERSHAFGVGVGNINALNAFNVESRLHQLVIWVLGSKGWVWDCIPCITLKARPRMLIAPRP